MIVKSDQEETRFANYLLAYANFCVDFFSLFAGHMPGVLFPPQNENKATSLSEYVLTFKGSTLRVFYKCGTHESRPVSRFYEGLNGGVAGGGGGGGPFDGSK